MAQRDLRVGGRTLSKPGEAMTSERLNFRMCITALCAGSFLAACAEEPPPRSANEFMENPILLEATMVRCSQNRAEARYDAECINAREAVNRLAAAREQAKRQDFEAQSERKRQALRRAQEAAAEARRRALEEERRRREAELLGEFEPLPDAEGDQTPMTPDGALDSDDTHDADGEDRGDSTTTIALPDPPPDVAPPETTDSSDLEAIRRELERRQSASGEQ